MWAGVQSRAAKSALLPRVFELPFGVISSSLSGGLTGSVAQQSNSTCSADSASRHIYTTGGSCNIVYAEAPMAC